MRQLVTAILGITIALATTSSRADDVGDGADGVEFMLPFEASGLVLSGAEYWPYIGDVDINYPDDVLWGFYPKAGVIADGETEPSVGSATSAVIACAEQAYRKLQAFIASEQPVLRSIIALGAGAGITHRFYLWTNDYSRASTPYPFELRSNRLWYWKRNPQVDGRTPGYWKWESTLTQDGTCLIPQDEQITAYLAAKLAELGEL